MHLRPDLLCRLCALVVLAILGTTVLPHTASAWWNDDWQLRKKLTIDTSAGGAAITDPIGAAPVLIRLHSGNFSFEAAKEDGGDLRFVAGDDKTPLKYHIEKWDSLLGEALVWVAVPDLKPGTQVPIWLYYGNRKVVSGEDAKATFDPDTILVYHFAEKGTPPRDWTTWGNTALSAGTPDSGSLIGSGLRFDGRSTVTLPGSPSLAWSDGATMTWSAWMRPTGATSSVVIFSRREGSSAFVIGATGGAPFVEVTSGGRAQRSIAGAAMTAGKWHHLAAAAGPQSIALFLDGAPYATLEAALPALAGPASLGGEAAGAGAAQVGGFEGEFDELTIAKSTRPAGFIKAAAIGQGGEVVAKFLVIGGDEEAASWLSGYFAIILKSVTLDGWVVIGLLGVMAVISWVVMAAKAVYVERLAKANQRFIERFRVVAADPSLIEEAGIGADDENAMANSSLHRLYLLGTEEVRRRFAGAGPRMLSPQAVAAIRAGLDTGMMRETQSLNRLMVVLTIAISGGPFLGLLGTVVGVMITFAAIAATGDVNVNAIAPGIAAALVATVAGLGVAIPALFGYNYLISRIKDSTGDMHVFVDEFTTRIAEFYSADSERPRSLAAE